jgi:RecJ-like exonuclease
MSCYEDDPYFDENMVVCDRCDGRGEVTCRCGGDLCFCGREDVPCPVCGGEYGTEGYITKELYERRAESHRKLMEAVWPTQEQTND